MSIDLAKKHYTLIVHCSRNGVSRDSGVHDECDAATPEEAIATLRRSARELLQYYDQIGCRVLDDQNQTISGWTLYPDSDRSNRDYRSPY